MDEFDALIDGGAIDWHAFVSGLASEAVLNGLTGDFVFVDHDVSRDFVGEWENVFFDVVGVGHEVEDVVASFEFITGVAIVIGIVVVVGLEVLGIDIDINDAGIAWLEKRSLLIAD